MFELIYEHLSTIIVVILIIVLINVIGNKRDENEAAKLQKLDEVVISIAQGWLGVLFLPIGKLTSHRITKRIQRYKELGYKVVSTEWVVNRFLLLFSRQTVFLFLRKEKEDESMKSLLLIQEEILNTLVKLLEKDKQS